MDASYGATPGFKQPSSVQEVFAYCDNLLNQPHSAVVQPGERHWAIFSRLCRETRTIALRVADAWFAALAIEHGCA